MGRRWKLLPAGFILVVLVVLAWTGFRAYQVRGDLTAARGMTGQLQHALVTGDLPTLQAGLPPLRERLDRAASRSGGPVWSLVEHLPVVGGNLRAVRRTALAAQVLGRDALPAAAAAVDLTQRRNPVSSGRVDLPLLAQLRTQVDVAARAGDRARALLATDDRFLLGVVRTNVAKARTSVNALDDALRAADTALELAPGMLGQDGPRQYFVAVQNNAEARATGGLIGAFALVTADRGKITLVRTGTDQELATVAEPVAADPEAAQTWQDIGSTRAWFDANLTPHFPDAARNIAGQWTAQSGQHLDGVLALDPVVMSALLEATGPVRLPGGTSVTAASVVDFVGHAEYVQYPDVAKRKLLLSTLAADLFHQVLSVKGTVPLLRAMAKASTSGHLFLWSQHPAEQRLLETGQVGGALPAADTPYLSVLTQNYGGDKLDFFLRRTVQVTRQGDELRVRVTLRNTAPAGLPLYMTVRSDRPTPPVPYGQAKVGFSVYGALSSTFGKVEVDGTPTPMPFDRDHGHPFGTLTLELPRDVDVVVTVHLRQPAGKLVYRQQPLVVPDELLVDVPNRVVGR
jgi:hypothetical protein